MSKCGPQGHCGERAAPTEESPGAFGKEGGQARASVWDRLVRVWKPCWPCLDCTEVVKTELSLALVSGLWPTVQVSHLSLCPGTGRGKDTLVSGDEDSSARTAARPALAQCRALSVDWAGPGSPHRLYLTVQVSAGAFSKCGVSRGLWQSP
jgi:hypothetical protein